MMNIQLADYSTKPKFLYLVQKLGHVESYWLYNDFEKAYAKMKSLAAGYESSYILEPWFIKKTSEWKMKRTFRCFDGYVYHYGNNGDVLLHAKFYIDAGTWENAGEEIYNEQE